MEKRKYGARVFVVYSMKCTALDTETGIIGRDATIRCVREFCAVDPSPRMAYLTAHSMAESWVQRSLAEGGFDHETIDCHERH